MVSVPIMIQFGNKNVSCYFGLCFRNKKCKTCIKNEKKKLIILLTISALKVKNKRSPLNESNFPPRVNNVSTDPNGCIFAPSDLYWHTTHS